MANKNLSDLQARCEQALGLEGDSRTWSTYLDALRLTVASGSIPNVMSRLKASGWDMLIDVTAVDLLEYQDATDRFRIVYLFLNTKTGERLEVRTHVNMPEPEVATVTEWWSAADWLEREVYDMFGIIFKGHKNLKRLLLPQEFASFPLRKDYPLKGRGERHNFPVLTRADS